MANPDEYDALKSGASGAAMGASFGGPVGAVIGGVAGAATPFIAKALGGLFGVTDAEAAEKAAYAPLQRVAEGGTTQGQAGMAYARGRTLQDLQGMANRGTAQQQAGLQRQAMQQAPEIQARYASQLADLRSKEQEHARSQLAYYEGQRAAADAKRKREALSGAIGSAVSMGTKLGMASGAPDPNELTADQANADNAEQAAAKPFGGTSGDLGAAYSERLAQSRADQARTDLFGGDGQYHAVAPSLASPGSLQLNGQNTPDVPETTIGRAPQLTLAETGLPSVQKAIADAAQSTPSRPYAQDSFTAPTMTPAFLDPSKSIYGSATAGPGNGMAASSPNLGFAPARMSGFGGMQPAPTEPEYKPVQKRSTRAVRGSR